MWFVRFVWDLDGLPSWIDQLGARGHGYRSEDGSECCAYIHSSAAPLPFPGLLTMTRLEAIRVLDGVDSALDARWHYVVATDIPSSVERDFNAWYDQEHLPGFAAVPGNVRSARYRKTEGVGPKYHACYDIVDRATLGSPAWEAMRATPWTSRVRPHFLNPQRKLYKRID